MTVQQISEMTKSELISAISKLTQGYNRNELNANQVYQLDFMKFKLNKMNNISTDTKRCTYTLVKDRPVNKVKQSFKSIRNIF